MNRRITERIAYKDAGRKMRLSRQRLAESELHTSGRAWRVWAACIELTASYSKNAERTTVVEIAALAGIRPARVSPILRDFDRLGVFTWRKDRGRRSPGLLVLPALETQNGSVSDPKRVLYLEGALEETSGLEGPRPGEAPHPGKHCRKHADVELYNGECSQCEHEAYVAKYGDWTSIERQP